MTRRCLIAMLALLLALLWLAPPASAGTPRPDPGQTRIIGGVPSAPGQWPWQVAILDGSTTNTFDAQFCGGAVIKPTWILTAAHCVAHRAAADTDVLAGTNVLGNGSGQRLHVAAIRVHPAWDEISNQNDEALLRLAKPTSAQPIPVVTAAQSALWAPGTVATATGWGTTTADTGTYPVGLRHVQVPIQSDATCTQKYTVGGVSEFMASSMLCAGPLAGGRDTCSGDSGGPLMVPGPKGAGWVDVGVTSWGAGCAQPDKPGVYSRLGAPSMAQFVASTIRLAPFPDAKSLITRQFLDFENRAPTASELQLWQSRLASGDPDALISTLESSTFWQGKGWATARLYAASFLRDPDTAGLSYWTKRAFAGVPLRTVASAFAASAEFRHRYGALDDGQFVDLVYRNILHRAADRAGRNHWISQLKAGVPRGTMIALFSESHENRTRTDARVRTITTWYGMLRAAPPTAFTDAFETQPVTVLIAALRSSYPYAART